MAYNGSVELISGITQKNNGNFPLVDASAVRVDDSTRLPAALEAKANASDMETALSGKVDKENGKGLSENDFTNADKSALVGIGKMMDMLKPLLTVENLFTKKEYIKGTDGTAVSSSNYRSTDYIPVKAGEKFFIKSYIASGTSARIAYYTGTDGSGYSAVDMGNTDYIGVSYTVAADGYLRFSGNVYYSDMPIVFYYDTALSDLVKKYTDESLEYPKKQLAQVKNLLTVTGTYLRADTGHEGQTAASATAAASKFMPVKAGEKVCFGLYGTASLALLAFYATDERGELATSVIKGAGTTTRKEDSFTAPSDGYIRICTNINGENPYFYWDDTAPDIVENTIVTRIDKIEAGMSAEVNPGTYVPGYMAASGNITTQTESVELTSGKIFGLGTFAFELTFAESVSNWVAVCAFDANGNLVGSRQVYQASSATLSGSFVCPSGTDFIRFSFRSFGEEYTLKLSGTYSSAINGERITAVSTNENVNNAFAKNIMRLKPVLDHLFVGDTGSSVVIPHESLFHIRLSKALGFDTIEANVQTTSDGVYFVNHLGTGGKFGGYFHHVDGETDISDVVASSVTWDYIVQNIRYNSTIEKFQTRPPTLEEFCRECRQQNIIPMPTIANAEVRDIVEGIMGKDNYLARSSSALCPDALRMNWVTGVTTKDGVIAYCEQQGLPFIYCMSNPDYFTDSELKEIVDDLHSRGFLIGTSYVDSMWYKYSYLGFDFNASQSLINRIADGNLYNIHSMFGFDDFTFTNATETDGVLAFSADGTLSPDVENTAVDLGMIDLEIWFNGSISIQSIGKRGTTSYSSTGEYPVFVATPVINGSLKPTINVASGTEVYEIKYKASKA